MDELFDILNENGDFNNAKNMQQAIEEELKNTNIPTIYVEVQNEKKVLS